MQPCQYAKHQEIEATHWWFRGRREILRAALAGLGLAPARVLDLGCGVGANIELLREVYPGARVTGIDLERAAVRFCRGRSDAGLCQADASALPFADGSFELVAGLDTLEHLPDDAATLAELRRVCAPGGHVVLTVPAFPALWGNVDELGHHFRRYRRAELARKVESAGLSPEWLAFFNFLLFPPIAALRLLARARAGGADAAEAEPRSDFDVVKSGPLNTLLARLFALEARLLRVAPPFGVSLLCVARAPSRGASADAA